MVKRRSRRSPGANSNYKKVSAIGNAVQTGKMAYKIYKKLSSSYAQKQSYKNGRRLTTAEKNDSQGELANGQMSYSKTVKQSYSKRKVPKSQLKEVGLNVQRNAQDITISATTGRQALENVGVDAFTFTEFRNRVIGNSAAPYPLLDDRKYILNTFKNRFLMCNRASGIMFVWIYDFICIRNTSRTPVQLFNDGLDGQTGSGAVLQEKNIWASPLGPGGQILKMFWKCVGAKKLVLSPGAHHQHEYYHNYNNLILNSSAMMASDCEYIAGVSTQTMFRMHQGIGGNITTVSTEGGLLAYVCDSTKSWREVQNSQNKLTVTNQHLNFLPIDNQMDQDGDVQPNVTA